MSSPFNLYPDYDPSEPSAFGPPSPSTNPHAGFHPSSFGPKYAFSAAALGASSSNSSSSLGMSISPPHYIPGNMPWGASGSFAGSLGGMGSSFGRERDRDLEAKYTRDFTCCGRHLNGLHELTEHIEEEHSNLAPHLRQAAVQAAQSGSTDNAVPASPFDPLMSDGEFLPVSAASTHFSRRFSQPTPNDAPAPPGVMDIEMDDSFHSIAPLSLLPLQQQTSLAARLPLSTGSQPSSPWAAAFRPQSHVPSMTQCLPPSLLSFSPAPTPPPSGPISRAMTPEQGQAKGVKQAQKKSEKAAIRDEASDAESEKRFPCPISGCGKVYKQANGLKYHLTRSINSGHGNVAEMGGIAALLGDKYGEIASD